MRIEVTLGELEEGVQLPLDERSTIVVIPSAVVEVRNSAGEPVRNEVVLVQRTDGRKEYLRTGPDGNLKLYGKRKETFNVTLLGRPKGQQGEAKNSGSNTPHAIISVNAPDGSAVANEEILVERADGKRETYFTNASGQVRVFGEPDEALKVCLVKQAKGHVKVAS